jgi:predicted amidophosphoribosyltransferase
VGLLDLLLPERCAGCGGEGAMVCDGCRAALVRLRPPLCARCGAPVAWPVERCRECAGRRLAFAEARAAVAYEGAARRVVGAWKQGGRRRLARVAAEIVGEAVPRPRVDAVTFVPPVAARELWRGHNPAERLAAELAAAWSLPCLHLLARAASPRPQRGLPLAERRRNVAGSFRAVERAPVLVLLVDDVYTSGATVAAAASALRRAGAGRVEVVTFARALRDRGSAVRR